MLHRCVWGCVCGVGGVCVCTWCVCTWWGNRLHVRVCVLCIATQNSSSMGISTSTTTKTQQCIPIHKNTSIPTHKTYTLHAPHTPHKLQACIQELEAFIKILLEFTDMDPDTTSSQVTHATLTQQLTTLQQQLKATQEQRDQAQAALEGVLTEEDARKMRAVAEEQQQECRVLRAEVAGLTEHLKKMEVRLIVFLLGGCLCVVMCVLVFMYVYVFCHVYTLLP